MDFDYKLLPPEIKLTLWRFILNAGTGKTQLTFKLEDIKMAMEYEYGGALQLGSTYHGLTGKFGFNPSDKSLSLSGNFDQFKLGGSADFTKHQYGLSLHYGASFLPLPAELSDSVYKGVNGVYSVEHALPSIMDENPIKWYQANKAGIGAATDAFGKLKDLADAKTDAIHLGADAKITYNPISHFTVMFTVGGTF